jgi:hypothetical protein
VKLVDITAVTMKIDLWDVTPYSVVSISEESAAASIFWSEDLSVYLSIYLSTYGSTAICWTLAAFSVS